MAEVKPIGSAVGAFEAQVFNADKAYRAYMDNIAYQRRLQATQQQELDKMMANTYSQRGTGRVQDIPHLEQKYTELQDFYLKNKNDILKGGKTFQEFQQKRSDFLFESEYSKGLKEKEKQLLPYWKTKAEKEEMSPEQLQIIQQFNAPIGSKGRDAKLIGWDGEEKGVDEISSADFEKYKVFHEEDLDKVITQNVKPQKVTNPKIKGDQLITGTFNVPDPIKVAEVTTGLMTSSPSARKYFDAEYSRLTEDDMTAINDEMATMVDLFKQFDGGRTVKFEYENDRTPGVSNAYEYAIYRQLKKNLPQDLGSKISFQPGQLKLGKERLSLAKQRLSFDMQKEYNRTREQLQNRAIDEVMSDEILSGTFDPAAWEERINILASNPDMLVDPDIKPAEMRLVTPGAVKSPYTGMPQGYRDMKGTLIANGVSPQDAIKYGDGSKAYVLKVTAPMTDADGAVVTDENTANSMAGKSGAGYVKGRNGYYYQKAIVVPAEAGTNPNTIRERIKIGMAEIAGSQTNPAVKDVWDKLTKKQSAPIGEQKNIGGGGTTSKPGSKSSSSGKTQIQKK